MKKLVIYMLFVLIISTGIVSANSVHNVNKGTDYTTIQDAINQSNSGDEIDVGSGNYYEHVIINKTISLKGIDTGLGKPIIIPDWKWGAIEIMDTDNVIIDGFHIINSQFSGIFIESVAHTIHNTIIRNNYLVNNTRGIVLGGSNNNTIVNNVIGPSIQNLDHSCNFVDYGIGIEIWYSNNNNINNNVIIDNQCYGIYLYGKGAGAMNNNISNNIFKNLGANIESYYSDNNYFIENELYGSNIYTPVAIPIGLDIFLSDNNVITNNHMSSNMVGIVLNYAKGNIIRNNDISMNTREGMNIARANNNIISGNRIYQNNLGIAIFNNVTRDNVTNNIIYNNFFNNDRNIFIIDFNKGPPYEPNMWNISNISGTNIIGGPYIGGNYWADHSGTGFSQACTNRGDGFCDSSYIIDSNNIDYLPLTNNSMSICGNTPEGQNVQTFPISNINIIFDSVTQCGNTTASISDNQWGPLPDNYNPITFFNINTTAIYTNSIIINISYLDSDIPPNINESSIKLFHYENGDWIDITTFLDTNSNTITGITTSLSPFSIAGEVNVAPTVTPTATPTASSTETPTISPTTTVITNAVKGSSSNYIGLIILSICLLIISILILRKR